ncbi:hypothetical protein, partial [Oceanithermus sp.]
MGDAEPQGIPGADRCMAGNANNVNNADNVNNIELIKRADHAFCHGGDYRQCSSGETLKSFDEIAD